MKFSKQTKEQLEEIIAEITDKQSKKCKICGSIVKKVSGKDDIVICSWKGCRLRTSIWKDTFFYNLKISKTKVLEILDLWMQKFTFTNISYVLNVERKQIGRVMKAVRKFLIPRYYESIDIIGGNESIVEIDESKFGKRKYNKGHSVEGVWILGMVEKSGLKRIHLTVVEKRTKEELTKKLIDSISKDSIIYSDCWRGYNQLEKHFLSHQTVNHSQFYKDPVTGVHTNTIEGCWAGVKMHVPLRDRTKKHIKLYLVRFMLLKNEKTHPLHSLLKYLF